MVFENLKYYKNQGSEIAGIRFTLDNQIYTVSVGAVGNRHYDEIMRQVAAGTITIEDAD
jgi:hypothetical protein